MSSRLLRGLTAVAVMSAAALTAAGTVGAASAAPASSTSAVISSPAQLSPEVTRTVTGTGADARQDALTAYWTPERMKAAKPDTEIPAVKAALAKRDRASDSTKSATKPQGPSGSVAPAAPAVEPKASTSTVDSSDVGTQAYYPNYPVGHPTARTAGKVFFTLNGGNYVCSGTIVNTEGRSSVWTAAHCLTGGGVFASNWVFVPNYYNGVAPYGRWPAIQLWSTTAFFYNNNDFANDVGSAVIGRVNGWRICDYLGGQGIAWNFAIGQYVYAFGYPQASPFNGQLLTAENGPTYNGGGGTIFMVNYMTGGSSGGGWLMQFDGNWGYLNGHNDFKYNALPQYMYSPYYGNQVANLYNTIRNISA
ncbi:trypsin-like serine peptidase [Micromonospora sp. NPDC048830]|uniref:trypsin-like serine peptidase n=1 Tax=Micromonospora sp. NPDC048830 TaxID=3364257 RepID=UPI003718C416